MIRAARVLIATLMFLSATTPANIRRIELPRSASATQPTAVAGEGIVDLDGRDALPFEKASADALSAFIGEAMATCPVPGASVAVVQDGEVVFLEGFGFREYGGTHAVTPDTLMRIGSVTKPVTTTLAAALVDDGLVSWETPVVDLLPEFALSDRALATRLTLADLFSAATGLPRRDLEFIFESNDYTTDGLLSAVAELPLTAPPGERFQYSNQAFALGGYALASAAGADMDGLRAGYEAAIRHWIFDRLNMRRSTFNLDSVVSSGNHAVPHAPDLSGIPQALPLAVEERFTAAVTPAGAMWSTAREMANFLQLQLGAGVSPEGVRVVSAENLRRTWQPGVTVPPNPDLPPIINAGLAHYGLGWFVGDFGGMTLINHSGGTFGFSSELAFLPEAGVGIAVLANDPRCGALLSYAVQYRLFEIMFDLKPVVATEFARYAAALDAQDAIARLMLGDLDAAAVAPVLGSYTNRDLGEITLSLRDGELVIDAGEVSSRVLPVRGLPGEPVRYRALDPPMAAAPGWFTFEPGPDGQPRPVLTVTLVPGEAPLVYVFTPQALEEEESATPDLDRLR